MKRKNFSKLGWSSIAALLALLWPSMSAASEQAGLDPDQYRILILLAVVGVAYLVTHLVLERLAERYGFVTGVEYIVLGAILGPAVLNFLDTDTVSALTPAVVLGTGSLGLWGGLHFDFSSFGRIQARALKSALIISLFTLIVVVGVSTAVIFYVWSPSLLAAVLPGLLCVGTVAVVADTSPLRSMAAYLSAEGPATEFGVQVAGYCSAIGIVAFGLIFCFYNTTTLPVTVDPSLLWAVWFGIHLLLGGVLGLVFATFLRRDFSDEKIITVVMGMVIFTSGFAYYLHLSPIFVNFILGIVLINTAPHADHVESRLRAIRRPVYIVLFFFAGAGWAVDAPMWSYALVIGYVVLRRVGRFFGSVAATRIVAKNAFGAGIGRALLAPGGLSVAMLLNFYQVFYARPYAAVVYNALLLAVVVTEIFSYPRTRSWLIDVADIKRPEQRKTPSENTPSKQITEVR
jgi:Kef-type K+ transport system membrane component KefB